MIETVDILIPTLGRAHLLQNLIANIHETTPQPHVLHFCANEAESIDLLNELGEHVIIDDGPDEPHTFTSRVNILYQSTDNPRL